MTSILDSVYRGDETLRSDGGDTSLGSHYEDRLRVTLTHVWRHKLLVAAMTAAALMISITLVLVLPKQYTAEAYVRGGFTDAVTTYGKSGGGLIALDASVLVETQSRLLQSQQLARRVVERLGLERIRPAVGEGPSWLHTNFYGDDTSTPGYAEDMAAKKLLRGLSVKTEPRVYLIVVSYTAGDPELAALITNAFMAEFLQTTTLEILYHRRDLAEQALSEVLPTLGTKHPKVLQAKMRLEAADARLKAQLSKTSDEIERTTGENVSFAQVTAIPSGPDASFLIGIALLLGLAGGVASAALKGRSERSLKLS
jgi:uncharacterized protein involved in exopolysaccharide biosynthesis